MIDPPQPGLTATLERSGLRSWRDIQTLANNRHLQDRLLDILVREEKITHFQSLLMADTIREVFAPCATMMQED